MATPGDLVRETALALDVSLSTVAVHDRNLAIAGLRTKHGRGPSAAIMTARDASRLVTAVMGSIKVKDSALTVARYAATRPVPAAPIAWPILELAGLSEETSFIDLIEALLTSVVRLRSSSHLDPYVLQIEVEARRDPFAKFILRKIGGEVLLRSYRLPVINGEDYEEKLRKIEQRRDELGLPSGIGMKTSNHIYGEEIGRIGLALIDEVAGRKIRDVHAEPNARRHGLADMK
jgi:hypothetical protein